MQEHIKDVHSKARFICDVCNKDYTLQRQLASHLVRVHDINGQELREKMLQAMQSQETRYKEQQEHQEKSSNNVATSKAAAATGGGSSSGDVTRTGDDDVTQEDENMQVLHVKEISSDGTIILEHSSGQAIDSKDFEMATLAVDEEQLPIVLVSGPEWSQGRLGDLFEDHRTVHYGKIKVILTNWYQNDTVHLTSRNLFCVT